MFRYLFMLILLMHGLIHFMGFAKAFGYGNITQLTKHISKPIGLLWFLTAILFITATFLFFLKKEGWWMIAAVAVLLSQILIIMYWNDAKFGTIANLIIGTCIILSCAQWNFNNKAKDEARLLLKHSLNSNSKVITQKMLDSLPVPVKRYFIYSNVVGKSVAKNVRLKQSGKFTMKAGQTPMHFEAEQYFSVNPIGFIWIAKMRKAGLPLFNVRDKYVDGRGNMFGKAGSLFTVVNAVGEQMDEASLMRFLSEMIWFPSSFLSDNVYFEAVDDSSAKVTLQDNGRSVSAIMFFDKDGKNTSMIAKRYYENKGNYNLETWLLLSKEYGTRGGYHIPIKGSANWKLKEGDLEYINLAIIEEEYDVKDVY